MKKIILILVPVALLLSQCNQSPQSGEQNTVVQFIPKAAADTVIATLLKANGDSNKNPVEKGVNQIAALWTEKDGTVKEFQEFCSKNYITNPEIKEKTFRRIQANFESLFGNFNRISIDLKRQMALDWGETYPVDEAFAAYEPSSHFTDDFFANKIGFITALNFPYYTLQEKTQLGPGWSRLEWAYARLGDQFTTRVPSEILQKNSDALSASENYISGYNIYVGNLLDDNGQTHFPKDMKLLSHWNLRDEIKANYGKAGEGLKKQDMIFRVMLRIIDQSIPDSVINNPAYQWNPYNNKTFKNGKEITLAPEPDKRYEMLLNNYKASKMVDKYNPMFPGYIQRAFDVGMEIPMDQVEKLFTGFCSSPEVKQVASLISKRLGRPLQPFDIWYDGFKARSSMDQEKLDKMTRAKYPNTAAIEKDIPNILTKLGFKPEIAKEIASHITVDPARGSGHAWGTQMKGDKSHLRTRVGKEGMDYKGYNIAIHELGHNVEQTISMYMVDNYMMASVPNTAFTEAYAFTFQKHDLDLLGINNSDPNKQYLADLDNFWMSYEIMGVSLLDMKVWSWMYAHPDATPVQLKETVISIAKEVWNKYYSDVLGVKDCQILAIYSHMIDSPLYLSNYPIGHLIDFQLDQWFKGKNFGEESVRIYSAGKLIPEEWMKNAVGKEISVKPLIEAADEALKVIK